MTGETAASAAFDGRLLILAPHMDDESLGCGLLLAGHPDRSCLHVAFVTDGSRSPEPRDGPGAGAARLAALREREAREALAVYGLPECRAEFLRFPDGGLAGCTEALEEAVTRLVERLAPRHVFVPFRYDRHPDHLAVNRAVGSAREKGRIAASIVEYFVYSQWRLLPAGDVRSYLDPAAVRRLDPVPGLTRLKRQALECHRSQTTRLFEWQSRPILTPELLDRVCGEAEMFLMSDPARPGSQVFARAASWIVLAHHLEPRLKHWKDRLSAGRGG